VSVDHYKPLKSEHPHHDLEDNITCNLEATENELLKEIMQIDYDIYSNDDDRKLLAMLSHDMTKNLPIVFFFFFFFLCQSCYLMFSINN
jgi:hypothetical protein